MASKSSTNRTYSERAGRLMNQARQEATTPRLIAAGTIAAGAAAYALLRDPARRDRLIQSARDYVDRGTAWWNQSRASETPAASEITVS